MKSKVLKTVLALMLILSVNLTSIYAQGATINLNKTTVKPGETVELKIALSTESIGYDIKIETTNSNLITSSSLVEKIGQGNAERVYLVQMAGQNDRTVYAEGTEIAKIRYEISENAKDGDVITIKVSGDVAGTDSTQRNTVNESVVLKVENPEVTNDITPVVVEPETQNETNHNTQNKEETQNNTKVQKDIKTENKEESKTQSNTTDTKNTADINTNKKVSNITNKIVETKKQASALPKAGTTSDYALYLIGLIVLAQVIMGIKYIKNR